MSSKWAQRLGVWSIAERFPDDIDSYTEGKSDFITSILAQHALSASELQSIRDVNRKPI